MVSWTLHRPRLQELPDLNLFHYWLFLSFPNPVGKYKEPVDLLDGKKGIEYLSLIYISGNRITHHPTQQQAHFFLRFLLLLM